MAGDISEFSDVLAKGTGATESWQPTMQLRWKINPFGGLTNRADLEQLWLDDLSGKTEWRRVPNAFT